MAMEGENMWKGRVTAKLTGCKADQVWPFLENFFNIHKWVSTIETCHGVEGESGQLGCIQYYAALPSFPIGSGEKITKWALEKVVEIDRVERCFSYKFVDNNFGFRSYKATMKVVPFQGSDGEGSEIVWSFVVNPVEGWILEDLVCFYDSTVEGMKEALGAAKQN